MKKFCVGIVGLSCLAMSLCALPAYGDSHLSAINTPFDAQSWGQAFNESSVGTFNKMQFDWLAGSTFEVPTLVGFSDSGWGVQGNNTNGQAIWVNTLGSTNSSFSVMFNGAQTVGTKFNFFAFNASGVVVDSAAAELVAGGWLITAATAGAAEAAAAVPLPAAAWMGMTLIGGIGALRAMRRKAEL